MTKTNIRLKRQALILSLLPDLVMAISIDGEINFCSDQVERVLKHNVDVLIGSNLNDILLPTSRPTLHNLINTLVEAEANEMRSHKSRGKEEENEKGSATSDSSNDVAVVSEQSFPLSVVKVLGSENNSGTAGEKNQNVNSSSVTDSASRSNSSNGNSSNSDEDRTGNSKDKENRRSMKVGPKLPLHQGASAYSSSTEAQKRASDALNRNVQRHNAHLERSPQHKDDVTGASVTANNADARLSSLQHHPRKAGENTPNDPSASNQTKGGSSSNKKNSSSLENLEVQSSGSGSSDSLLSGVEEKQRKSNDTSVSRDPSCGRINRNGNMSEDSGYREGCESSPSREDSASSVDSSNSAGNKRKTGRLKPLAPTCNICLIRNDLTTIWCEVTSSIRTRSLGDELAESMSSNSGSNGNNTKSNNDNNAGASSGNTTEKPVTGNSSSSPDLVDKSKKGDTGSDSAPSQQEDQVKELLLCLRPIREGEEKVSEELRFRPKKELKKFVNGNGTDNKQQKVKQDEEMNSGSAPDGEPTAQSQTQQKQQQQTSNKTGSGVSAVKRPMKKRPLSETQKSSVSVSSSSVMKGDGVATDTEKSVVESLMFLSNKQKHHKTN
eukprot:CAMPEP_0178957728 /NCGR_PEP_ID=MMETSP0789-20121207/11110_1 /TAXON_ID=3005 /ORGANISM="Rhizosolenia setigera, Strain CCMP 1694" /LENGTH=608 /DNA_ID=CAMNT_0020640079 /DNA_START=185 /DNA_END=2011 /DNA_ORIENTATION=+